MHSTVLCIYVFGHRSITGGQWGLRKTVYLASGRKGHESFCKERGKEKSVTAGYGGWTGSEGSGNGSQTPWSVCTPHSGGHTPWYTGIHDNQGTGSTQTCRMQREEFTVVNKQSMKWKHWGGKPFRHSRSGLNTQRTDFVVAPSHSLKRRVIVTELSLAAQEVLHLIDSHSALPVVLGAIISNIMTRSIFFSSLNALLKMTVAIWINCNRCGYCYAKWQVGSIMYDVVC